MMTTMEELMQAALQAPEERKTAALKALRGEVEVMARPVIGPLLLGMGAGAKFLGVSRATLWRACQAGSIQKVELFPGSYRVRREDLEALALRHCSGQAAGECGTSENPSRRGRPRKLGGPAAVVRGQLADGSGPAVEGGRGQKSEVGGQAAGGIAE